MSAARWLARVAAALADFARGFVGIPASARGCADASHARAALADAASHRDRCC